MSHHSPSPIPAFNQTTEEDIGKDFLDFNDQIVVTNSASLFCGLCQRTTKNTLAETYVVCTDRILCCRVFQNTAFWGGENGRVFMVENEPGRATLTNNPDPALTTPYGDNITSIDVCQNRLLFGDVNAEIHISDISEVKPGGKSQPMFLVETGHKYGAYVWSVNMDATRIFSGDSEGKMVVHDFWQYDEKDEIEEN